VDARPGYWTELDPNKVAELNAADLIIISRTTVSDPYAADANEVTAWNGIETPILNLAAYLVGSSGWNWVNDASVLRRAPLMVAVDPNHAVFAGVELDPNGIAVLDPNVGAGTTLFLDALHVGNGTLIGEATTLLGLPSGPRTRSTMTAPASMPAASA